MKLKNKFCFAALIIICVFAACSKMDSTYVDFIKKGSIIYVGSADSAKVHPGKNRLKLSWKLSDPSATLAKIYWNNKSDSLSLPIDNSQDTVGIWMNDLNEGSYSFDIFLFDKDNNKSVISNVIGNVYGDNYISSLLARPVKRAIYENGKVTITWGSSDTTVIATVVKYVDASGTEKTKRIAVQDTTTVLDNYDFTAHEDFEYTTLYLPDDFAVDTFYSAAQTVKATGPPNEYNRSAWIAGTEDYDVPSGRVPAKLLDGDVKSVWHMDKSHGYPHSFTIDMKNVNLVNGFTYNQRTPLDGAAKLVEIQVSADNVVWKSLGAYTLENSAKKEYLELLEPASFRYFRMIFRSDYKNGNFTAIAELGAYKR